MNSPDLATILMVEDDPGVARLQQLRAVRAGYNVLLAATAEDALRIVRGQEIDLLLLDQNLSGSLSGLELYEQVKAAGIHVPAILVTGLTGQNMVLQAFRAGVFDFVPKTADYLDYLLPAMERVLQARRMEIQLAESEARLGAIIASAMDAVLTVDERQRISLFNPAAERMFGCSAINALGEPVDRFLPNWQQLRPAAETDGTRVAQKTQETDVLRTDGICFPVEAAVSWMETPRRRFWTCLVRDIRERRRAQEERERLIREQAARREAEAAKGQMEEAARENARLYNELRRADQLKDEFLAMLAHELRNPLAPIHNALQLVQVAGLPQEPTFLESFAVLQRQVNHLVRLVDDLLDVNRIRQGKIQLRKERVLVADIVARALETSKPLIDERRHHLTVRLPEQPMTLDADPVRIVQVLANLLNNAAKYTPEGGSIELSGETMTGASESTAFVDLRVRDTGMGIAPDMVPRLFDVFTQSHRTLDRAEGGLGIGLTLVRRLTEMHGGTVEASSPGLGKGSEFLVRLPLAEAAQTPGPAVAPAPAPAKGRRVLIVDDSRDAAETLARLLTVMGHRTATAHDGAMALQTAADFEPEIVFLDIGLPGMDGYEVAGRLRADPLRRGVRLVALTGYGTPDDRRRSLEAGFDTHLVKPVDLEALQQLLAHAK